MKMRAFLAIVIAALAFSAVQQPALSAVEGQTLPVGKLSIVQSTSLAEIDIDKMKGQPAKLAWSADGKELYLQVLEGAFGKGGAERHYVFTLADGRQKSVDAMPAWANEYWTKKSSQASPDDPSFKINIEISQRTERTTSAPMGGELARGATSSGGDIGGAAGGTSSGDAIAAAAAAQSVTVNAMKLAGETVGEFVNSVIVPGLTFGWGPSGSRVIVFTKVKSGELVIMDSTKKKQEVDGTKDAILPAFSDDGRKLAWLKKDGRKKFSLLVADVAAR